MGRVEADLDPGVRVSMGTSWGRRLPLARGRRLPLAGVEGYPWHRRQQRGRWAVNPLIRVLDGDP